MKPICDNSTLEALMRLFLPAHDHKLSLLISLCLATLEWVGTRLPALTPISKLGCRSVAYLPKNETFESYFCKRIRIRAYFLALIPMYSISMTLFVKCLPFLFYCIWPLASTKGLFFRHSTNHLLPVVTSFIFIEILAIIPNRYSNEVD